MPAPDAAPVSGVTWKDRYWTSRDGLKLHYRDYTGRTDRPPLLMLHGLTRNSRDFENVAARYAGDWRVIAVDFRGRGQSARDPNSAQYVPGTYAADVIQLLDELGVGEAVFLGTSLGGLVTMIVAQVAPERIAGVLFHDWDEVADTLQDRTGDVHPRYGRAEWLRFAKRICRQTDQGVEFDYDMAIADPFNAGNTGEVSDGWPYYRVLAGRPILVLRGETSDLLSDAAAQRMATEIPDVEVVTVPRVGHAPDLDEPEAVDALDRLLERVLKR